MTLILLIVVVLIFWASSPIWQHGGYSRDEVVGYGLAMVITAVCVYLLWRGRL